MKVSDIYGSKYLKSDDIKGHKPECLIADVIEVEVKDTDGTKKARYAINLDGLDKLLLLNATNAQYLAEELGDDTDDWVGCTVKLGVVKVMFGGKKVDGLRITSAIKPVVK